LPIHGGGDVSDFGFFEKGTDPVIVTREMRSALEGDRRLIGVITRHIISKVGGRS